MLRARSHRWLAPALTLLSCSALTLALTEAEAEAASPQRGGGFDEGGYILGVPGGVGLPLDTDDFGNLDPTYGWGFGGGWMFARGRVFKATVGGAFEHSLMIFDNFEFDDFGGHILRFLPEARIGAGNNRIWGYGLAGIGAAVAVVHNDLTDNTEAAGGLNMQFGGGIQGMIWRNLFLGGEFDFDLGFFFDEDRDLSSDDDFAIHQVTIEFMIGWYF
ncbi:hypothetical protein G6O69_33060 [Pseudenhygromyxa sp. WMMC2535]|uniref:hypothetical protein n=1 Tax=Pseudenhygromyxa sp. WMMC2535 TaxID=2712867 RepID=UPI0015957A1D|nr:hypothetical protein [Pseudenhygromyxa sp. WMMC2535]NVB42699.1 hypothetical protein [Pseudenhygromyxa sp. WMMC2535]